MACPYCKSQTPDEFHGLSCPLAAGPLPEEKEEQKTIGKYSLQVVVGGMYFEYPDTELIDVGLKLRQVEFNHGTIQHVIITPEKENRK